MLLTLNRDAAQPDPQSCTLGKLLVAGSTYQTIERPWVPDPTVAAGKPFVSCIPRGLYLMEQRFTEARGQHWILSNSALGVYRYQSDIPVGTSGRYLVLMHVANWAHELAGCIAPGLARAAPLRDGNAYDEWMVSASGKARDQIAALTVAAQTLQLEIT